MSKDTAIHYVNFHPLTGTEQPRSIILIYIIEIRREYQMIISS